MAKEIIELVRTYGLPLKVKCPRYFGDFYFIAEENDVVRKVISGTQYKNGSLYRKKMYSYSESAELYGTPGGVVKTKKAKEGISDKPKASVTGDSNRSTASSYISSPQYYGIKERIYQVRDPKAPKCIYCGNPWQFGSICNDCRKSYGRHRKFG